MLNKLICAFSLSMVLPAMANEPYQVAITQIVSHPALNAVRDGIIAELKKCKMPHDISIKVENEDAGGNMTTAGQIAIKVASDDDVKMIIALSTPSAQTTIRAVRGRKPVLFSAITDPIKARLVNAQGEGKNVSGVSDAPPLAKQIQFMQQLMPKLKTVGIIWNGGEDNARSTIYAIRDLLQKQDITVINVAISKSSDIPQAVAKLAPMVDAFYVPNDNMMASSIESLIKHAMNVQKPVFAADILLVERGCVGMIGVDYNEIGHQTAQMACKIIKGDTMPSFENPHTFKTYINLTSAQKLRMTIPTQILKSADMIFPISAKALHQESK